MDVRDDIDMRGYRIFNLKNPLTPDDVVNKYYVDSKIKEILKDTPSKDIYSKIDEVLKEMKYNYSILKDTIEINTSAVGVENIDEMFRKHVNSSLKEVLDNMDKNYQMLKNI